MVRGIDKFREFFTGYEGNYVIIGGTACEMHEEIYAQTPRATKDIDIILIVEALSSDFAAKFWEFVKTAGYRQRNKGTGNGECRHEYYRFKEPGNPDFPYQIELFSRNIGVVKFPDDAHITPIPVDDDLSSLSAILMDDDYYNYTIEHSTLEEGVSLDMDIIPPVEGANMPEVTPEQRAENNRRMALEDSIRNAFITRQEYPVLLYPMIDFIERNPAPFSPNAFVPIPYAARYNHIEIGRAHV